jgi:hypothetical protein
MVKRYRSVRLELVVTLGIIFSVDYATLATVLHLKMRHYGVEMSHVQPCWR